ncbi:hypothetical protein OP10G_3390 [Fimbriimonas ginsengisoli Gsoil 348]|uniref:Uncharacterized protein n=1 Tax=Fimbriimonas ginsengisoli Gsoil 348 TaxID=661478 RepID=A0A068NT81_FIMGI|nr:hypothetical protein OP10G_3390 [Fimbriimonas ginsengisoli Gsoil 348]
METELGLADAFYGLINRGWDFSSFEERDPGSRKSRSLPPQAYFAEIVVGAFDLERAAGRIPNEDLLAHIESSCSASNLEIPPLDVDSLERIRLHRNELFKQWAAIAPGEELRLTL